MLCGVRLFSCSSVRSTGIWQHWIISSSNDYLNKDTLIKPTLGLRLLGLSDTFEAALWSIALMCVQFFLKMKLCETSGFTSELHKCIKCNASAEQPSTRTSSIRTGCEATRVLLSLSKASALQGKNTECLSLHFVVHHFSHFE